MKTNKDHYTNQGQQIKKAAAIHYDPENADAPVLKAKGKGLVAEQIIKLAKEKNIPIQEDPSLVELLAKLDLNEQIPAELYEVVAEVLAMVYTLEKKAERDEK